MDIIKIALKEYATHDIIGKASNSRVLEYFHDIGQKWVTDDDTAWCAAFVNWVLLKAGLPTTGSLLARSFLTYGSKTTVPQVGDIVVFWRISPSSIYGHVGFFIKEVDGKVYVLGGNQNDSVNITAFPKNQVLDYRVIPAIRHA